MTKIKIAGRTPVLSVTQVQALPEFGKLKVQQQKFVLLVAAGATPIEAVRGAYGCTSQRSGERFLYGLLRRPSMQPVLNLLYGLKIDDKAVFLERIDKLLRKGEHVRATEVAALTLFGVVKGYLPADYSHTAELEKLGKV